MELDSSLFNWYSVVDFLYCLFLRHFRLRLGEEGFVSGWLGDGGGVLWFFGEEQVRGKDGSFWETNEPDSVFSSIVVLYDLFMGKVLFSDVLCFRGGISNKSSAYFDFGLEYVQCGLLWKIGKRERERDLLGS